MIYNIVSAYYFNPLMNINTPWNETIKSYTLRWLVRGNADFEINSKKIHLCSGQIIICRPCSSVEMNFEKDTTIIYSVTTFDGDLSLLKDIPFEKPLTISSLESEILLQFFYTSSQYYNEGSEKLDSEPIKQYTLSLLETFLLRLDIQNGKNGKMLFSESTKTITQVNDQRITFEIKQYLIQHLSTSVSLKDLSEELGVSINTAMHVFKKNVGMGIITYFTKLKVEKAMELIDKGELSFRTISERLGFESPEYFSRVFKKQIGMTPTEYAKQQNKWSGCLASLFM